MNMLKKIKGMNIIGICEYLRILILSKLWISKVLVFKNVHYSLIIVIKIKKM